MSSYYRSNSPVLHRLVEPGQFHYLGLAVGIAIMFYILADVLSSRSARHQVAVQV